MNSQFEAERKKMTSWAFRVTILYVVFLFFLAVTLIAAGRAAEIGDMKPSEVGDLLAGVGSPFALIWLVYGYFLQGLAIRQQAEELSQNTHALHLQEEALRVQAQELKNSVEQQRELVDVSRKQFEAELSAVRYEQDRQRRAALPNFVMHKIRQASIGTAVISNRYSFDLENIGNSATDVEISSSENLAISAEKSFASYPRNEKRKIKFSASNSTAQDGEIWIQIDYIDAMTFTGKERFQIFKNGSNSFSSKKIP